MLADNILFLKKRMPEVYQQLVNWEKDTNEHNVSIEYTKDGNLTLRYQISDNSIYLHSKYNPLREASMLIDKLEMDQEGNDTHVVFYGIGLGYHIKIFLEKYPQVRYSLVEPSCEVMINYLENNKIEEIVTKNLIKLEVGSNGQKLFDLINQRYDKHLKFVELPVYPNIFESEYREFKKRCKHSLKIEKMRLGALITSDKRWVRNIIKNFKTLLTTPDILQESNGAFTGKTAIIVAAGPSLNDEIENLKRIKKDKSALIFSVGSAINTLIHHGIYPDAMCTYDPHEVNQRVFKTVNELKIDSIPMIFGSSVAFEVLEQYKGPKFHMLMLHDPISLNFIADKKNIKGVHDAASIAIVTLELLAKLEIQKIVLVGQNLAYLKESEYAEGISYAPEKLQQEKVVKVEDVDGNMIESSNLFMLMKDQMEALVAMIGTTVINTTRGGAKINGTKFRYLDQVIQDELESNMIAGDEFSRIFGDSLFHKATLEKKIKELFRARDAYNGLLIEIKKLLNQLERLFNNNNKQEIIDTNIRINNLINDLEANLLFKLITMKMNRGSYQIAVNRKNSLKNEGNEVTRIKKNFKAINLFIDKLLAEKELNELLLDELKVTIEEYQQK